MDRLHHEHLPETLEDARILAREDERQVIDTMVAKLNEIQPGQTAAGFRDWLAAWLRSADKLVARQIEPELAEVVDAVDRMESSGVAVSPQEVMEMLTVAITGVQVSVEKGDEVLAMEGWW